jgi:hypothetical protein
VLNFDAQQVNQLATQIQWAGSRTNSFLEESATAMIYRVDVGDFLHERKVLLPVNTDLKPFLNKNSFKYCFEYYPELKLEQKISNLKRIVLNIDLRTDIFDFVTIDKKSLQIPFEGYDGLRVTNSFLPIRFLSLDWEKYENIYKKEKKEYRRKTCPAFFERKFGWQEEYPKYPNTIKTPLEKRLYDCFLNDQLVMKWVVWIQKIKNLSIKEINVKSFLQEQLTSFLLENNNFPQVPIFVYAQKIIISKLSNILENELISE